ncbi:CKLF-like MARVEL transmembrane domain-containing protein 3 isoform X1 [Dendrobates tinctorius]|uniref:CKLF-like MARVEL transmembrane domain-containing protein 3 isoform X1 n=1 Tax=Dendrobates tinctorius TaxID=92724 RepID=UPI003CCA62BF
MAAHIRLLHRPPPHSRRGGDVTARPRVTAGTGEGAGRTPCVVSLITFICYVASTAVALMTVPLIEFLWALFTFFAYSTKLNEQLKGIFWPLLDFIRCVSAAIIYFVISLVAVSKYSCAASKAAAVLGFIATIVYAFDFYIIFNDLIEFLKKGDSADDEPPRRKSGDDEDTDSDSD